MYRQDVFLKNQPFLVMRSRGEPLLTLSPSGYAVMLYTAKMDPKIAYFWPLQKISRDQICFKLPKIN